MSEHRLQINSKGANSRNEDWWYLIFDEEEGVFYVEHEWHYLGNGEGTKRWQLNEVPESEAGVRAKAVRTILSQLFNAS